MRLMIRCQWPSEWRVKRRLQNWSLIVKHWAYLRSRLKRLANIGTANPGHSCNKSDEIKLRVASGGYDFVILDLLICRNEGLSLLSDTRRQFDLPIIVTAPSHIGEGGRAAT
ncbi:hypothetical protein OZ411_42145 [Bradyrhizobium sp. Arg237L]|uniref:hypothetical protein n=1 Tax=Bradyrhizobium sp. Arg237L TaxID=3003352 RepID=UPI00249E1ECA|nr:hypothetical protein [Bradyrhizobium sp. Arg237L]MDI4239395.1 hypothetical protein [Bradyrhizobium sp. Arg237L]